MLLATIPLSSIPSAMAETELNDLLIMMLILLVLLFVVGRAIKWVETNGVP